MSSSNDAVFLRRNNQVQDAIDSQNMKQALQLIEKRIKKGENTQFLKASHPYHQVRPHCHEESYLKAANTYPANSTGLESAYSFQPCG